VRFGHYRGLYLMHCHQLEHEGAGMMVNFQVV
jgi:FtsP/CotA-like multicopper oxidase with cupredoxin domain